MESNLTKVIRTPPTSNPQSPTNERGSNLFSPGSSSSISAQAARSHSNQGQGQGQAAVTAGGVGAAGGHETPSSSSSVTDGGTENGTYTTSRAPSRWVDLRVTRIGSTYESSH